MTIPRVIIRAHRWLGLLVGVQVVLWITGGVVMSALHITRIRGEDRTARAPEQVLDTGTEVLDPLAAARAAGVDSVTAAALDTWLDRPVYRLEAAGGQALVDAATGARLSPVDAATAREIATRDYTGPGAIRAVTSQAEPRIEIRGATLPLWRVDFDDRRHTTLYVSPETGRVVARRNDLWRVYDVFWMLHIMDYRTRDDFNNPLLVGAALVAWLMASSGIWLIVLWLRRRFRVQYRGGRS